MATLQVGGTVSPPLTPALNSDITEFPLQTHNRPQHKHDETITNPLAPPRPVSPEATPNISPTSSPNSSPKPSAATQATRSYFGDSDVAAASRATPVVDEKHASGPQVKVSEKAKYKKSKARASTADDQLDEYPRLSKPVELLRNEYDVVVIGSGYGGGVAASRMARTGQSVCVLERGRERWPGEYPEKTADALKEMHVSGTFAPGFLKGKMVEGGDPTGMYHLIMGRGQNAVVCNGLGGTSLINANVFMEADKGTLSLMAWPPQIRDNASELGKYYKKAEEVLQPQQYPEDAPRLAKLDMLKAQAEALGYGDRFKRVRQTTRFRDGPNSVGVTMSASELTGQDVTGINDGSKNTTLVTYLADAWNWGAEMFCECEVRYIEKCKDGEGYLIYFAWYGRNRGAFKANLHGDLMWVKARKAVFLGAGAIASTEILLRSKAMGLPMSDEVGQNMSGNGDILAFGYNTDEPVNSIGRPAHKRPENPVGPCITGVIDCRENQANPLDGFVIEEGAVPSSLAHLLQFMLDHMPGSVRPNSEKVDVVARTEAALARYGSKFLGPYFKKGAIQKTQIYLIMSHDSNQAVLSLKDDKPVLEFLGVARSTHVKELNELLAKATEAVGGTLVHNPFYALMGQQVTVHPIGGACMARDNTGNTGVTNHVGAVFTGEGPETHDGLIVTDASVIPTALGANPFATITALAERSVEAYALSKGLTISEEKNGILDLFGEPKHRPRPSTPPSQGECDIDSQVEEESLEASTELVKSTQEKKASGFGFTEVMSGFVHYDKRLVEDNKDVYELAHRTGRSRGEVARFFLSVQSFDLNETMSHHQHRGMLTGTFVCPSIPGSPFMVQRGEFNLFILNNKAPGTRNLTYDFDMKGTDGRKLHFHGYKVVDASVALSVSGFWKATTTLYVTVSEHEPGLCADLNDEDAWRRGTVLAKGMMCIQPSDFLSEIATMTPQGSSTLEKISGAAKFLTFFTRKSLSLLLAPLAKLQYPSQSYTGFINPTLPDASFDIKADDGVKTQLHMWNPTHYPDDNPANAKTLFMVPGAAVDHQIYALPTIPFNAVNYFTRAGYRVYVTVHRIGQLMVAKDLYTTYDVRLDLKACLEHIRKTHGPEKVYTIAHCMGSVAFSTGLLDGTIPADWIRGVTCSQVFMNPIWGPANMAKVKVGPIPLDKLYTTLAGHWFDCSTSAEDPLLQRVINQLLRLYPQSRKEMCNNAACHRCSFVFGRCWQHNNLNEATHRQMDRFFGGVNMRLLNLLMKQGSEGHVMTNGPEFTRLDTEENIRRLEGIPFLLWVGRENAVLSTESTERTFEALTDTFGMGTVDGGQYRRRVVPGYGHLDGWMGRNAWKDVYPFIREEVDRVCRGESYKFVEPDDRFKRMRINGELLFEGDGSDPEAVMGKCC